MADWSEIAQAVVGTALSLSAIAERFDVDEDDIEEALLDLDVETCPGCGWWVESGVMVEAEHGDLVCEDCA